MTSWPGSSTSPTPSSSSTTSESDSRSSTWNCIRQDEAHRVRRNAARARAARGDGKPETFDFLGFTHYCGKNKSGGFWLRRKTISKRMRAKLAEVKDQIKRRRHLPIPEQGKWLGSVVRGHLAYYAVPGNTEAVAAFRDQVIRHWFKALRRRSQRTRVNWHRMSLHVKRWLPPARPMPPDRALQRSHPRQEPSALAVHAGICAGGRPKGRSLPQYPKVPGSRPGRPTRSRGQWG